MFSLASFIELLLKTLYAFLYMHASKTEARIAIQLQQTTLSYFLLHGSLNCKTFFL